MKLEIYVPFISFILAFCHLGYVMASWQQAVIDLADMLVYIRAPNIRTIIYIYINLFVFLYIYIYGLQPQFIVMESSILDIFSFVNGAGAWKTIMHSSEKNNTCLYTKT